MNTYVSMYKNNNYFKICTNNALYQRLDASDDAAQHENVQEPLHVAVEAPHLNGVAKQIRTECEHCQRVHTPERLHAHDTHTSAAAFIINRC